MKKRILSMLLAFVMVLGMIPGTAFATGSNGVTVGFMTVDCLDGEFVYTHKELTVTPGLAKEYLGGEYGESYVSPGWIVPVTENDVTVVDVLVAAHLDRYGDIGSYIGGTMDYVTTIFGTTADISFTVNGIQPYDPEGPWGKTGYAANQSVVKSGDDICFYLYSYSDTVTELFTSFAKTEIETTVGENVTLHLGYKDNMGYVDETTPAAGAKIHMIEGDRIGAATSWVTDSNGAVTVSFSEPGTYYLTCKGTVIYMADTDWDGIEDEAEGTLSPAYCKVVVTAAKCAHETWNAATCTTPKTCANCGATEGEADSTAHSYVDGKCEYCEQAEPVSYPFTLTVGGEELTITDLGTTVECTKMYYTAKQMKVTVPAGTTTVVVNGVSGAVTIFPNHGSQKNASPDSNTEVSVATGTYLCMRDIIGGGWYHVAIEFAPCENHDWQAATCTTPKTCANCGATEGEADSTAHSYVDGKCEYCEQAEPVSYPFTLSVGGETLEITDLGATEECSCGTDPFTPKKVKITVPAGTQAVDIALSAMFLVDAEFPMKNDGDTATHTVTGEAGDKICLAAPAFLGHSSYHIYIEIEPCATHNWQAATCKTPKTCANCGATEGEADSTAHSYVDGKCEYCEQAEPVATPSYTIKLSEAEELTAGLNYFISVPADAAGKDIIFDFGSGTISGMMCQRHCSKRNIHTAGEGSTLILSAETVAAHLCDEAKRAEVAEDFDLYLTEGSQMFAFYWWTTANLNGSYIYIEILPAEEPCAHETWNAATCTTPKTCANCGATEGEADPTAHSYVEGVCEHCGETKPAPYTIKLSEAEELTAGLNYFISVPAGGKDIIFDFGAGTISGAMCQRHCSKRDIWTAGEGSTMLIAADKVAAHLCNESQRAKVASDFNLYLTEGSQMFAFYWWTTANPNGSYIYIEILPAEDVGGGDEDTTYTVTLPTNNVGFSVRATSSPTVTAGGEFSFKLNIYDDYKKGENFKVKANGVELTSSSDTYTITNITENVTVTVEGVVEKTLAEKNVTVIVPAGSTVTSGLFHSYFKYDFAAALEVTTLDNGRVQYIVPAAPGGDAFIRVQHPDGVTYWDFGDLNVGKVFNITEEMLFIGSTEYTKETVYANYEKNGHDTASLYLTANAQGWLDMDSGDTHSLNVFRNWIPVSNSTSNTGVSLPDVTYTVVDINGNPSDVVIVTPDANNSCYADIKAVKAGTAIILVSYDAVYNADGEGGKQFSAIWPENTGVIVVTVDAEDANIETNITVNEEANAGGKQILDVEHDILFYVGNTGAEYSFKPEDGCTVTISRSTVGNEMTFNGFTNEGVTVSEDGTVTLSGLTTGAHVVKVEKDGKAAYQVIRAREVSYKLTHSDGSEVTAENPAQPGETITVQFSGLIDPMGKLSGVYNAKYGFHYVDEAGTVISIKSSSGYGEYYFGSNPVRQRFTITVPAEWNAQTYTLTDGGLSLGGWGSSFGAHRATTYMEGKEPNLNASGVAGVASVLPDVVIPVYAEPAAKPDGLHCDANGIWWYYEDGVVATAFTGLVYYSDLYFYVENGMLNWDYTGLVSYGGAEFYVENGILNWNYTGLVYDGGVYHYVESGMVVQNYIGLCYYSGTYFYIENGKLDWDYTGLCYYAGMYFYIENGMVNWEYIGLCYYAGTYFYVENGMLNWDYTGLSYFSGLYFYVENGMLNWDYTGLCYYSGIYFYVGNGLLDWNYTGIVNYAGVWFYVENGMLTWNYNGTVTGPNGTPCQVSGSIVQV